MARYLPESRADIEAVIAETLQRKSAVKVTGFNTKTGLGGVVNAPDELCLSAHQGIIDYQPEELVLVARSGTPLVEIEAALAEKNQMLAFEPPHLAHFYTQDNQGSIGGLIAANLSGPRRISAGAARDYVLGFDAVSGRGSYFRSGSKVMKNVTGYDLSKLMCGSFGALAVMSEVTLKVLPRPEYTASLSVLCSDLEAAQSVLATAFMSAVEPSGGAICAHADGGFQAVTRLEGVEISVKDRMNMLQELVRKKGKLSTLEPEQSMHFWQIMRDLEMLDKTAEQVWKLSVTPSQAPAIIADLQAQTPINFALDWAGGLIWVTGAGPALGPHIRSAIDQHGGGHATLMRACDEIREQASVFQPLAPALGALQGRIKTAFDPENILNPQKIDLAGAGHANTF